MFIFAQKVTHFNLQSGTFQFFDYKKESAIYILFKIKFQKIIIVQRNLTLKERLKH